MNRSIWRPILRATQHRYVYTKTPTSTPSLSITRRESSSYRGKSKQAKRRDEEPERWIGQTPLSERLHPNQRDVVLDSQKGVEQFLDIGSSAGSRRTGRSWRTSELRLKSFDDLHRLWYILLKERNVLLTEKAWCKTNGKYWTNGESNMTKVKMSMARVKGVVAERTRAEQHRRWVEEEKEMKKLQEKRVNYDLMFDDDGRRMKKPEHEMAKERSEKLDFFEKRDPEWRDKWMFEVELSRSRRRKWLRRRAN